MLSHPSPAGAPLEPCVTPPTSPGWAYTVAVRELCEFTAKRGDLDRRFTPAATALEGVAGQSVVAQRRGQDYETEIALETTVGALRVRGRADGYDRHAGDPLARQVHLFAWFNPTVLPKGSISSATRAPKSVTPGPRCSVAPRDSRAASAASKSATSQ